MNSTMYAKYAMGAMTVGVQTSEKDVSGGSTSDTESQLDLVFHTKLMMT